MRCPIPVDERVAIAIWWLANTVSYRLLGQQFGLARSTVAEIVIEVCLAMEMELLSSVIRPGPTAQQDPANETTIMTYYYHIQDSLRGKK
ncbi:UNVERIFIED_CONTAM: hypothetical protein K2H54_046959 [Gekko kuhli]